MDRDKLLKRIMEEFKNLVPEAQIILYDSYARGEERPDSDIDLLFLLPGEYEGKDFVDIKFKISDLAFTLGLELGVEISPLVAVYKFYYEHKTPLSMNISNEGIEL